MSHMLDGVPVLAVMVEDVGQRGAHRTAYLDFVAVKGEAAYQSCLDRTGGIEDVCRAGSGPNILGLGLAAAISIGMLIVAKNR